MAQRSKRHIYCIAGTLIAIVLFCTRKTWFPILLVLGMSACFSLILTPACTAMEKRGIKRNIAALIAIAAFLAALLVFLLSFVPYLVVHVIRLAKQTMPTVSMMLEQGNAWLMRRGIQLNAGINLPQMLASAVAPITTSVAKGSAALVSGIGNLAISLVMAYYLLCVRREAGCHFLLFVPTAYRYTFLSAAKSCKNAVLGYLSGQIKTSVFIGGATFVCLALLEIKEALILALFMAILEALPYIGPILGSIPILLCVIPLGFGKTMLALALVLLIQQIESGVIGPYFTASSTSIHPLSAIIGVFIGGSLFGLSGVLLAVPGMIILRSVYWSLRSASIHQDS